jgi:hypothetical protein
LFWKDFKREKLFDLKCNNMQELTLRIIPQ